MQIFTKIEDLRAALTQRKAQGQSIGFVPTMGYLHEGHLYLMKQAQQDYDCCVVSIFVNPKQFGENEDFSAYPRDLPQDIAFLEKNKIDILFAPDEAEMWPEGCDSFVEVPDLSDRLMGALRPGHFRGVTSIVLKLLNIIQPDALFLGEKDFQQVVILSKMVKDLNLPVHVIGVPTQREEDGLACSSRNRLLLPEDRQAANVIYRAIKAAQALFQAGQREIETLQKIVQETLCSEPRAVLESLDFLDVRSLQKAEGEIIDPIVLLLSVQFGQVRLIDQYVFQKNEE